MKDKKEWHLLAEKLKLLDKQISERQKLEQKNSKQKTKHLNDHILDHEENELNDQNNFEPK